MGKRNGNRGGRGTGEDGRGESDEGEMRAGRGRRRRMKTKGNLAPRLFLKVGAYATYRIRVQGVLISQQVSSSRCTVLYDESISVYSQLALAIPRSGRLRAVKRKQSC